MKSLKAGYINSRSLLAVLKQIWQLTATETAADTHNSQTHSTEAILEDKTVINKSAFGQMIHCCGVDKYLENILSAQKALYLFQCCAPGVTAKAVDSNHHREVERCSSLWQGVETLCSVKFCPKGQTPSYNRSSRAWLNSISLLRMHRKNTQPNIILNCKIKWFLSLTKEVTLYSPYTRLL